MSRTNQKLINYHSSGNTEINLENLYYGEIAVRHAPTNPQLIIKTGEDTKAIFVDSAGVESMITNKMSQTIQDVDELKTNVSALSGNLSTLSANVTTMETRLDGEISSLRDDISELSGYVETECATTAVTSNLNTRLAKVEQDIPELSASVISIENTYATKDEASEYASAALINAKAYTDEVSESVLSTVSATYETIENVSALRSRVNTAEQDIMFLSGAIETISGAVDSMESDLIEEINEKLSIVYKFRGSKATYEELLQVVDPENGDVYNVVEAHGTPGQPDYTPAGTNYAWNASGVTGGEWDALGGALDLSIYATSADVETLQSGITINTQDIAALSASVMSIEDTYATKIYVDGKIDNVFSSAKTYTDLVSGNVMTAVSATYETIENVNALRSRVSTAEQDIASLSGIVSSITETYATKDEASEYASAALANAKTYTDEVSESVLSAVSATYATIENLNTVSSNVSKNTQDIATLSGSVVTIEPKANSALQGFELTGTGASSGATDSETIQCGAVANFTTGGTATLDLSSLVIDCGEF